MKMRSKYGLTIFNTKLPHFYRYEIEKLLKRWQTIVDRVGEYIVDD